MRRNNNYTTVKQARKNKRTGLSSANPGKRKIYFTRGGDKDGAPKVAETIVASSWKPGRTQPSKRFIYR